MKASIEVLRRVYDDAEGVFIEVGLHPDSPDWVCIDTSADAKSKEWYGANNLPLPKAQARLLAKALLAACDDVPEVA